MKILLSSTLLLFLATSKAEEYRCPQTYPGKDAPAAVLTGATMRWGELHGDGWLTGDDEAAEGGQDIHYGFADDEQAWLVCSYGGKNRIKGRFHDGHEWNQHIEGAAAEWWVKLRPKVSTCTVQLREVKSQAPQKSTWTASAICK